MIRHACILVKTFKMFKNLKCILLLSILELKKILIAVIKLLSPRRLFKKIDKLKINNGKQQKESAKVFDVIRGTLLLVQRSSKIMSKLS